MRRLSLLAARGLPSALLVLAAVGMAGEADAAPPRLPPAGGAPEAEPTPPPPVPGPIGGAEAPSTDAAAPPPATEAGPPPPADAPPPAPASDAPGEATEMEAPPADEEAEADDVSEDEVDAGDMADDETATGIGMVRGREEPSMQTLRGGIGLFHTQLPRVGSKFSFRFHTHTDFFRSEKLFVDDVDFGGDTNSRIRTTVNLGFTFTKYTELFFALSGGANRNERVSPTRQDRETIYALGDMDLGIKAAWRGVKGGGVGVGGTVGLSLVSGAGQLTTDKLGFYIDALVGADLRYLTEKSVPVRLTANIGYFQDNSYQVTDFGLIDDLPSREVARFGLAAMQPRVRTRIAVDAPIRFGKDDKFGIDPILEFSIDSSVRQNDDFVELTDIGGASPIPRMASWLTLGLRANVYDGLQLDLGVDIGTTSPNYEYGPPTPPYQVMLGLGWSFDPTPVAAPVEEAEDEAPAPELPVTGRIVGTVMDAAGAPVPEARISIPSVSTTILLTDQYGAFTGYSVPPGLTDVVLMLPTGETVLQQAEVVEGEDASVEFVVAVPEPEPEPEPQAGVLSGTFTDETGAGVAGTLRVTGGAIDEDFVVYEGGRTRVMLPYGQYQGKFTAEGFNPLDISFEVNAENVEISGTVQRDAPPETPNVSGSSSRIRLRRGIRYRGNDVSSASFEVLGELATFLKFHPEYKLVEVQVHTDDRGNPRARSRARAQAVVDYLIAQGVDAARLKSRGLGDSQPVAVNLTEEGRRKNNRTLLRVRDYAGE